MSCGDSPLIGHVTAPSPACAASTAEDTQNNKDCFVFSAVKIHFVFTSTNSCELPVAQKHVRTCLAPCYPKQERCR